MDASKNVKQILTEKQIQSAWPFQLQNSRLTVNNTFWKVSLY